MNIRFALVTTTPGNLLTAFLRSRLIRRNSTKVLLAIALLIITAICPVLAQETLSDLRTMWQNGRYSEVAQRLIELRKKEKGRTPRVEIDYMIATSLCRTTAWSRGKEVFQWMLENYDLGKAGKDQITKEMQSCPAEQTQQPARIAFRQIAFREVGVWGDPGSMQYDEIDNYKVLKERRFDERFFIARPPRKSLTEPDVVRAIRDVAPEEFQVRNFTIAERQKAVEFLKNTEDHPINVASEGHFILVSDLDLTVSDRKNVFEVLEELYVSFQRLPGEFDENSLITLYMLRDHKTLNRYARRLHGIELSEPITAYSIPEDLSIVCVAPLLASFDIRQPLFAKLRVTVDQKELASFMVRHLFRLRLRSQFGIPPWLYYGMARYYDWVPFGKWRASMGLFGNTLWAPVSVDVWNARLPVKTLVSMDWDSFQGNGLLGLSSSEAGEFVSYLDERHKLGDIFEAFRKADFEGNFDSYRNSVQLLEQVFGKPMSLVESDFSQHSESRRGTGVSNPFLSRE